MGGGRENEMGRLSLVIGDGVGSVLDKIARVSFRASDTPRLVELKSLALPLTAVLSLFFATLVAARCGTGSCWEWGAVSVGLWTGLAVSVVGLAAGMAGAPVESLLMGCLCLWVVALIFLDWGLAALLWPRAWPAVLLLLNVALVADLSVWVWRVMLGITLASLLLERLDAALGVGLHDASRGGGGELPLCNCASPPCGGAVINTVLQYLLMGGILVCEFGITAALVHGTTSKLNVLRASCDLANVVTAQLGRYEIEPAEDAVKNAEGVVPQPLRESLSRLVVNLRHYRAFLPQSCLVPEEESASLSGRAGSLSGKVGSDKTPKEPIGMDSSDQNLQRQFSAVSAVSSSYPGLVPVASNNSSHTGSPAGSARLRFGGSPHQAGGWSWRSKLTGQETAHSLHSLMSVPSARTSPVIVAPALEPREKKVTLVVANRRGWLQWLKEQPLTGASGSIDRLVTAFSASLTERKGVVDLISGDHAFGSFNAVRPCGTQSEAAVVACLRLQSRLKQDNISCVCCSGHGLCSNYGNADTKRFMVVGTVSADSHVVERLATRWGCDLLVDQVVRGDVDLTYVCRLKASVHYVRRGRQSLLWEVLGEKQRHRKSSTSAAESEWMYDLAGCAPNPWDAYNSAMRLFIHGKIDLAGPECASAAAVVGLDHDVRAALLHLEDVVANAPPPLVAVLEPIEVRVGEYASVADSRSVGSHSSGEVVPDRSQNFHITTPTPTSRSQAVSPRNFNITTPTPTSEKEPRFRPLAS
eukprot:Hpha_TRINITY_DN3415_c0_g2::TRINITY_DN3415_c0_g2_i1::g.32733::m.32733